MKHDTASITLCAPKPEAEFNTALSKGKEAENRVLVSFGFSLCNHKLPWDAVTASGNKVEIKSCSVLQKTGNFSFEYESNDRPGDILNSFNAYVELLFIYNPPTQTVYILDLMKYVAWARVNAIRWKLRDYTQWNDAHTNSWINRTYLIPIRTVEEESDALLAVMGLSEEGAIDPDDLQLLRNHFRYL